MADLDLSNPKAFIESSQTDKWETLAQNLSQNYGNVQRVKGVFGKGGAFQLALSLGQDAPFDQLLMVLKSLLRKVLTAPPRTQEAMNSTVTGICGLLSGAKQLCEAENADFNFHQAFGSCLVLVYFFVCREAPNCYNFTLAQKIDKALAPLSIAFIQSLQGVKMNLFVAHIEQLLKAPNLSPFRNTLSIALTVRPELYNELQQSWVRVAIFDLDTTVEFAKKILIQPIQLMETLKKTEEVTKEQSDAIIKRLVILGKGAKMDEFDFKWADEVTEKIIHELNQDLTKFNQSLEEHFFHLVLPVLNDQLTLPDDTVKDQVNHLLTTMSPVTPDSLSNVVYQNVLHDQYDRVLKMLKAKNASHRLAALNALNRWLSRHIIALSENHPAKLKQGVETLVYLCQDAGDASCRESALKFLRELILNQNEMVPVLKDILEGDTENQSDESVNMSSLLVDANTNVRKEFSILLRVCNHSEIRWSRICKPEKVIAALSNESSGVIQDILVTLLRYRYFPAKSLDDKEKIMDSVKGLLKLYEQHGHICLSTFIKSLVRVFPEEQDYNVFAAVLRKFGHQISNSINGDEECQSLPQMIVTSLHVGALLWEAVDVTRYNTELEIVNDANTIWVDILNRVWKMDEVDDNIRKTVLKTASKFPSDTVDRLYTKITARFKQGVDRPKMLIETMVSWEKTGDLWSLITDWLVDLIVKVSPEEGSSRNKKIRFSDTEEKKLSVVHILKYLDCLTMYDTSSSSAASSYTLESLVDLERAYVQNLADRSNKVLNKLKSSHFKSMMRVKQKLREKSNKNNQVDVGDYVELMKSYEEQTDVEIKTASQQAFQIKLKDLQQQLADAHDISIGRTTETVIEDQLCEIVRSSSTAIIAIAKDFMDLLSALLKYRIASANKSDSNLDEFILKAIEALRHVYIDVLVKAEGHGSLEFPEKEMKKVFDRILGGNITTPVYKEFHKLMFDSAMSSIDVSYDEFAQNPTSAVFAVNMLATWTNNASLLDTLLNSFEEWLESHSNQSEEALQREEYLAAWILTVMQNQEFDLPDNVRKSKMFEIGRDYLDQPAHPPTEKSKIFDESGFDNEHSFIRTPKKKTFR